MVFFPINSTKTLVFRPEMKFQLINHVLKVHLNDVIPFSFWRYRIHFRVKIINLDLYDRLFEKKLDQKVGIFDFVASRTPFSSLLRFFLWHRVYLMVEKNIFSVSNLTEPTHHIYSRAFFELIISDLTYLTAFSELRISVFLIRRHFRR